MASTSYSKEKIDAVINLIDSYTGDTLDNYIRDSIKKTAKDKMDNKASAVEVANAVFDYITDVCSGDDVMALACKQICPKTILYILRNEIITALNKK